jgi:hypothetical protein
VDAQVATIRLHISVSMASAMEHCQSPAGEGCVIDSSRTTAARVRAQGNLLLVAELMSGRATLDARLDILLLGSRLTAVMLLRRWMVEMTVVLVAIPRMKFGASSTSFSRAVVELDTRQTIIIMISDSSLHLLYLLPLPVFRCSPMQKDCIRNNHHHRRTRPTQNTPISWDRTMSFRLQCSIERANVRSGCADW